jgi:intergrase/recombinase
MPHWDEDSAQLRANLQQAQEQVTAQAIAREPVTVEMIRAWHATTMEGLVIPEKEIPANEQGHKPQAPVFFG